MSAKSKKSTRKINLQVSDPLTIFFDNLESTERSKVFSKLKNMYNVELKINAVGMLIIKCQKDESEQINDAFVKLNKMTKRLTLDTVENVIGMARKGPTSPVDDMEEPNYAVNNLTFRKKNGEFINVTPKNQHQADFLEAIFTKQVAFGMGSPGTGKSFLALAASLKQLYSKKIHKIVITKPVMEVGPSIGFLPGSVDEKLSAYSASFMGILSELVGAEQRDKLIETKAIQIENIGFLRGMTLGGRDGVIFILDESQNADFAQHKMILSRLGDHPESKIIYAGDQRQSDLKNKKDTLSTVYEIVKTSPYVGAVVFTKEDVVRSAVVKDLLGRIEDWEDKEADKKGVKK